MDGKHAGLEVNRIRLLVFLPYSPFLPDQPRKQTSRVLCFLKKPKPLPRVVQLTTRPHVFFFLFPSDGKNNLQAPETSIPLSWWNNPRRRFPKLLERLSTLTKVKPPFVCSPLEKAMATFLFPNEIFFSTKSSQSGN